MLRIKPGVALLGMRPEILLAVIAAEPIWYQMGTDLTITSCTEGVHSKGSRHYSGLAIDLRTRGLSNEQAKRAAKLLADALGDNFDVVLEETHIHVEFDPERGGQS